MTFDQPQTLRLLKSISGDGDCIAEQGERAAEQATMALDSLFVAYAKNAQARRTMRRSAPASTALFQQLDDPSAYNGFQVRRAR